MAARFSTAAANASNDTQVVRGRIRTDFPGGSPIQY